MKPPLFFFLCAAALAAGIAWTPLEVRAAAAPLGRAPAAASYIDNFDSLSLDGRWGWVNEDPSHWSLSAQPGALRITTQTGGMFGAYYAPEQNILVTDAPAQDFIISTKVTIALSEDVQTAGILYFQDEDNYLNLVYVHDHGSWVSFHKEVGGSATYLFVPDEVLTPSIHLRISKRGDVYTGYYSTDGNTWSSVGAHSITLTAPKVGLAACNGPDGVAEIPADFDYFQLTGEYQQRYLPRVQR